MATKISKSSSKREVTQRAVKSSGPSRIFQNSDASLARYFRTIGSQKTLDADEEIAQTKALFELEQQLWINILKERSRIEIVGEMVQEASSDTPPAITDELLSLLSRLNRGLSGSEGTKQKDDIAETTAVIAETLRDLDEDRSLVGQVLSRIRTGTGKSRNEKVFRIADRVKRAKHHFISENLGLVVNIAKRYHVDQMSLADLIQEGNLGLMRAVDKFDYRKGFRFSTYASWWIRSYISRAIVRKSNTVRIPEYMLRDRNRIKRTDEAHRAKVGRSLSQEELASELGLSKKRLERTLRHDVAFVESLDREMPGNDNQKYIDFLSDEDAKSPLEMASLNDWLKSIPQTLEHLSVVERFVICWRFGLVDGDEMTLQEIGQCLSLSRERIRQIQEEALGKLRDRMEVSAA